MKIYRSHCDRKHSYHTTAYRFNVGNVESSQWPGKVAVQKNKQHNSLPQEKNVKLISICRQQFKCGSNNRIKVFYPSFSSDHNHLAGYANSSADARIP